MPAEPNEYPHLGADHQLPAPESAKPRSKVVRIVVWVALLLIFAVGFYVILTRKNTPVTPGGGRRGAAGGTVTITTATAQRGDIGVYLDAIGTVTPVYTSSITAQVSGVITTVHYKEGQIVRKGEPLIDIDSRPYRATLLQAQGILERDQNILAQAQMDVERYRAAWARNAIPKQTLDDQEKVVLQDQGTVKNDEGTVQYDQIQVDYCHIVAPFTGRVGLRLVDPGNVVTANGTTTLAVITQVQPITVIFTIAEDTLGQVAPRLRQNAKLPVDAYDRAALKKIATGTLLTLDNQIDTTTGTLKARASFDNKDLILYPNEFVNTRLLVNTLQGATLIPSPAIQHNGDLAFVYVIQDSVAHMRTIKTGVTDGGITQITGINPGDVLATSSFEKLQDKAKIAISKTPLPTSTTGSDAP
ncbi:efflux RND transporter periplasmic adaptor subunit [Granulicella arctica]|uniref:Multidrug efflux system membrane fusion protein n=1 Tax=Granulicella arctica TaxID=940613 RepID=A0A7Y9PFK0_9BACT|nr:efflux RND transporter periplasmic adaptor subunit [Granulicella arctica]NYF78979.1 multidrug efflux system membrane fusion protein [Granulicella arctica]